jgi:hypothetical protein
MLYVVLILCLNNNKLAKSTPESSRVAGFGVGTEVSCISERMNLLLLLLIELKLSKIQAI